MSEGGRELRASDQASAEREEEENACEEQHFSGRTVGMWSVADTVGRGGAPIDVGWDGRRRIFWKRWGHGMLCAFNGICTIKYSIADGVRASFELARSLFV